MNSISSHAAGRAAYTQSTKPSTGPSRTSSPPDTEEAASVQKTPDDSSLQTSGEDNLTAQERAAIQENFPEDPELSMRLYGRGRGAKTVGPDTVGSNLDVTG